MEENKEKSSNKQKIRFMYSKKELAKKFLLNMAIVIVGVIVIAVVMYYVQINSAIARQKENAEIKMHTAQQRLEAYSDEAQDNQDRFNSFSQAKADTLALFYSNNLDKISDLKAMANQWQLTEFYILDKDYNLLSSNVAHPKSFKENAMFKDLLEDGTPVPGSMVSYYKSELDNGYILIAGRECHSFYTEQQYILDPARALGNMKMGSTGYIIAVDTESGQIVYHPDNTINGYKYTDVGFSDELVSDGFLGWTKINNEPYYAMTRNVGQYTLVMVMPKKEILDNAFPVITMAVIVFGIFVLMCILYMHFIRTEHVKNDKKHKEEISFMHLWGEIYFNIAIGRRVKNIMIIGVLSLFVISLYTQILVVYNSQTLRSNSKMDDIISIVAENQERLQSLIDDYDSEYVRKAQNISYLLNEDPRLESDDNLKKISETAQIRGIYIFNNNGEVVSTNTVYKDFVLSKDEGTQSYEFWNIIKGYTDTVIQDAMVDDTANSSYVQYIGTKRLDESGIVQLAISPQRLKNRTKTAQVDYILGKIAVENRGFTFAVNKDDDTFVYYPNSKYIGRSISEYNINDTIMRDEYIGYQQIDGQKCLVTSTEYNNMYIFVAVPVSAITEGSIRMAIIITVFSFIVLCIIAAMSLIGRPKKIMLAALEREELEKEIELRFHKHDDDEQRYIEIESRNGDVRRVQTAQSRWDINTKYTWHNSTAEEKIKAVIYVLAAIISLIIVLYVNSIKNSYDRSSIFSYIVNKKWEMAPNIFSFTYILIVLLEVAVCTTIVRKLIKEIVRYMGARVETIGRLVNNFIKYFSFLGTLFYCMSFLGVDANTLLASAGIFTLIIGLGAQSLVSDILAGLFIVFEGEFRVGDIVMVDTWRGTVLEIGIRSTKVEDMSKNVKIINNASIKGVVNMTKKYSFAAVDVGIEYQESLERVESVLSDELPKLPDRLPAIENGPFYKGVVTLGDSSVVIRIVAQCQETDRVQLIRDLNREIKLIFDRNDINIPFPQIVLNQASEDKTDSATFREKIDAKDFVQEQKEASKDIFVGDTQ